MPVFDRRPAHNTREPVSPEQGAALLRALRELRLVVSNPDPALRPEAIEHRLTRLQGTLGEMRQHLQTPVGERPAWADAVLQELAMCRSVLVRRTLVNQRGLQMLFGDRVEQTPFPVPDEFRLF